MSDSPEQLLDKQRICELIRLERFYRDRDDWDRLAECYAEDSRVRTTWFDGTGRDFVAASREMASRGRRSIHLITPTEVRLNGDRALVESLGEIHNRSTLEGIEVDTIMYCRFFSRVRREEGTWRLASFDGIYHMDTIAPVNPAEQVPIDWAALATRRPSYRIWAYMISLRGYEIGNEELGDDRPDLLEPFYAAAERWLATGTD